MKASVVNTELNLKVKRVILMIFSIDVKCFLQFACTNLDGSQKEGGGGSLFKFASERGGYPERRGGGPSEKGGFQPWRKL